MRLLACLIMVAVLPAATPAATFTLATPVADSQPYRLTSDVRIKRMYLMRPDLMAYPVIQDYYA